MHIISRLLKLVATGAFSLLLAACYGTISVMYGVPTTVRQGIVRAVRKSDGTPIPEIRVNYAIVSSAQDGPQYWGFAGHTDGEGECEYEVTLQPGFEELVLRLDDRDGSENGGAFLPVTIQPSASIETVRMELDQLGAVEVLIAKYGGEE